ncbi:surface lipoprotein [Salinisphaera sp. PC39]|uniref:MlaA family lipoprotein n=1 Tax=Salinisphaera sp. PC39 TaxID=1304156 RepID=UPI00333E28B7
MYKRFLAIGTLVVLGSGCAHSPPADPWDPLEPVNRKVYQFNDVFDRYAARPVAKAYRDYTPSPVRRGVGNFFDNARYPITAVNSFAQGKFGDGTSDIGRFLINTTAGFLGVFDVATSLGLEANDEDFGQTLGAYGLGQGAYLMLPFLGPSTGRDVIGDGVDQFANPLNLIDDFATRMAVQAVYLVDLRASFLGFDRSVRNAFDPYTFVRTAYLEDRLKKVHDGDPPRERLDLE